MPLGVARTPERRAEAEVVEHRGPQLEAQAADVLRDVIEERHRVLDGRFRREIREAAAEEIEIDLGRGDALPDLVVKIARKVAPLVLLHLEQLPREPRQHHVRRLQLRQQVSRSRSSCLRCPTSVTIPTMRSARPCASQCNRLWFESQPSSRRAAGPGNSRSSIGASRSVAPSEGGDARTIVVVDDRVERLGTGHRGLGADAEEIQKIGRVAQEVRRGLPLPGPHVARLRREAQALLACFEGGDARPPVRDVADDPVAEAASFVLDVVGGDVDRVDLSRLGAMPAFEPQVLPAAEVGPGLGPRYSPDSRGRCRKSCIARSSARE